MRVRAISVDVDGTLYRVRRLRVAWRLRHRREVLVALLAARERIRFDAALDDRAALEEREAELVSTTLRMTVEESRRRLRELHALLPSALTERTRPYPGVMDALLAAHRRGIALSVLSDFDPTEKLERLGLSRLPFSAAVGCDTLGALKPHARGFLELARRLGVDPREVLHVGDREELDVAGAHGAGMRAWRFSQKPVATTDAERVFSRWSAELFATL